MLQSSKQECQKLLGKACCTAVTSNGNTVKFTYAVDQLMCVLSASAGLCRLCSSSVYPLVSVGGLLQLVGADTQIS